MQPLPICPGSTGKTRQRQDVSSRADKRLASYVAEVKDNNEKEEALATGGEQRRPLGAQRTLELMLRLCLTIRRGVIISRE